MKDARVREILAGISRQPVREWSQLLAREFPNDPMLAQQALLWLHAMEQREDRDAQPSLGPLGDQRYELTVKLDSGATASVWQAYDRKLGRNVAIKILHAAHGTTVLAQLLLEARAACDVISDHVVRILDVHDDGTRPYIVMELVGEHDPERGELVLGTAASACRPRSVYEVARWVMQVARGVHDAHSRNVFHRDLKPDNVLITPLSRTARIADFGLAVSAASEDSSSTSGCLVTSSATGPISVSGTPEFMAPEQARGLPLQLDPRIAEDRAILVGVDVWGLGAVAYALLGGKPPWTTDDEHEPWELAASTERPHPLARTSWGDRIPSRLRRIVEKAMADDPAARYQSAASVANELEAFLDRRPTSFDRYRHVRAGLWCRRNPHLALGAAVAAVLATLVLGTRATVSRLRGERNALNVEVASQQDELHRVTTNVEQTRAELDKTEQRRKQAAEDLAALEKSIADERAAHEQLLQKKESKLQQATAASRQLVEQLEVTRREAEETSKQRDKLRAERDKARADREAMKQQRDSATADRDEARRALATLQQELARLAARPATGNDSDGKRGTGD